MLPRSLVATKPEELGIDAEKLEMVFARAKRDVDDPANPHNIRQTMRVRTAYPDRLCQTSR